MQLCEALCDVACAPQQGSAEASHNTPGFTVRKCGVQAWLADSPLRSMEMLQIAARCERYCLAVGAERLEQHASVVDLVSRSLEACVSLWHCVVAAVAKGLQQLEGVPGFDDPQAACWMRVLEDIASQFLATSCDAVNEHRDSMLDSTPSPIVNGASAEHSSTQLCSFLPGCIAALNDIPRRALWSPASAAPIGPELWSAFSPSAGIATTCSIAAMQESAAIMEGTASTAIHLDGDAWPLHALHASPATLETSLQALLSPLKAQVSLGS